MSKILGSKTQHGVSFIACKAKSCCNCQTTHLKALHIRRWCRPLIQCLFERNRPNQYKPVLCLRKGSCAPFYSVALEMPGSGWCVCVLVCWCLCMCTLVSVRASSSCYFFAHGSFHLRQLLYTCMWRCAVCSWALMWLLHVLCPILAYLFSPALTVDANHQLKLWTLIVTCRYTMVTLGFAYIHECML